MVTNDPTGMAAHLDAEAAAHATHVAGMAGHGMTASAIALLCTALEPRAKDDDDIASCLVALTTQAAEIARLAKLRGAEHDRYWEARYRDEAAENERLKAGMVDIADQMASLRQEDCYTSALRELAESQSHD